MAKESFGALEKYVGTEIYILDGCEGTRSFVVGRDTPRSNKRQRQVKSYHAQKVELMAGTLHEFFEATVKKVSFSSGTKPEQVPKWFRKEFKKSSDTFKLVYFHGRGGRNGEDYTWKFEGPGSIKAPIDAYAVIQAIVDSGSDCLVILDCYVPSRFRSKWVAGDNTVTILGRGEEAVNEEKDLLKDCDFTSILAEMLEDFMSPPCGEKGCKGRCCRKPKSVFTINQLLGKSKRLNDNPKVIRIRPYVAPGLRHLRDVEKDGPLRAVSSAVIVPSHVQATGKISFFRKVIQDEGESEQPASTSTKLQEITMSEPADLSSSTRDLIPLTEADPDGDLVDCVVVIETMVDEGYCEQMVDDAKPAKT